MNEHFQCPHCGCCIPADMIDGGWVICPMCEEDVEVPNG